MRGRFRPAILLSAGYRNAGWGTAGVRRADRYNRVAALIGAAVKAPETSIAHAASVTSSTTGPSGMASGPDRNFFGSRVPVRHIERRLLQSRDIAQADATR